MGMRFDFGRAAALQAYAKAHKCLNKWVEQVLQQAAHV